VTAVLGPRLSFAIAAIRMIPFAAAAAALVLALGFLLELADQGDVRGVGDPEAFVVLGLGTTPLVRRPSAIPGGGRVALRLHRLQGGDLGWHTESAHVGVIDEIAGTNPPFGIRPRSRHDGPR